MRSENDLRRDLGTYLKEFGSYPEFWTPGYKELIPHFTVHEGERPMFEEIIDELVERFGEKWATAFKTATKQ